MEADAGVRRIHDHRRARKARGDRTFLHDPHHQAYAARTRHRTRHSRPPTNTRTDASGSPPAFPFNLARTKTLFQLIPSAPKRINEHRCALVSILLGSSQNGRYRKNLSSAGERRRKSFRFILPRKRLQEEFVNCSIGSRTLGARRIRDAAGPLSKQGQGARKK